MKKQTEECYRNRHHDFYGLTSRQTAKVIGISIRQVNRLMATLKKDSPQLFPILTTKQARLWSLWFDGGLTCYQIAESMGITERTIQARLSIIKKMMDYNEKAQARKTLSIDVGIDETKIVRKF